VAGAVDSVPAAGAGSVSVAGVLESPALQASPQAKAFLASGGADPRMVSLLGSVLSHHQVGVASVVSASSPVHVQALEIVSVDGQPVGPDNFAARDLVTEIAAMSPGVRPDEIGTPWPIQSPGFFSDQTSQGSLHLAFEMPGTNAGAQAAGAGVPGAGAVASPVPVPGAAPSSVPGAAGSSVPGAANSPVPAYAAAAYPAAAAPGTVQPAVAGAVPATGVPAASAAPGAVPATGVPATGVPATPAAPGSAAAEQAQQLAGSGAPVSLAADPTAGAKVSAMVRFADSAVGKPYIYGGGHGDWSPQPGYDCSGFVSAVLHAAGYLTHPVDTTAMPSQPGIEPGPGKFVTIFDRALSGHDGHVIIEINGQFYESGGMHGAWGGGGGVEKIGRPSDDYLKTFPNVLHPQGL
jgi:cell wall-associated NlpC family hydrolase